MTALKTETGIALSFAGRFKFGIGQWAYVPFDVPDGIRRIDVSTSHGPVLPARHRPKRWSGVARAGFMLSAVNATPGYLAGPIDPGRWALALGPVVLNPLGMDWQAQVVLTEGVQPSLRGAPPARIAVCNAPRAGWYRGDLHTHTVHSDGLRRIEVMAAAAAAAGLDFIVSTDHNTNSANRAWAASGTDLEVIAGEEVTTRHGHRLAVGLPPQGWVDWRYAPRDGVFASYAAQVRACGGLVVAAHPSVPLPEFGYRDVDAVEVWNGVWKVDDELSLRIWHQLLRQGRRITAVGGSDSHAEELSTQGIISGLRRSRAYLAESSVVTLALNASHEDNKVTVTTEACGAPGCTISLMTDGGCVGTLTWTAPAGTARFGRVEVRRRARFPSMVALSNPVWLDANRPVFDLAS